MWKSEVSKKSGGVWKWRDSPRPPHKSEQVWAGRQALQQVQASRLGFNPLSYGRKIYDASGSRWMEAVGEVGPKSNSKGPISFYVCRFQVRGLLGAFLGNQEISVLEQLVQVA